MAIFDEVKIKKLFEDNLEIVKECLKNLDLFRGDKPDCKGLKGLVFEKTIQCCIEKELKAKKKNPDIQKQVRLYYENKKSVVPDMTVGNIAIEIKTTGLFNSKDKVAEWCRKYRGAAQKRDLRAVLISLEGSSKPLWETIRKELGSENVFCLFFKKEKKDREWEKFVKLVCSQ